MRSDLAGKDGRVRLACVGDSITEGHGTDPGMSYPEQLQCLLGEGWTVGNFGVCGRTMLKRGDFPYWDEKSYRDALDFLPDVVVLMLGTNDTKPQNWRYVAEFSRDYRAMVESFLGLESRPEVWVCRPCPVFGGGDFGIASERVKEEIRQIDGLALDMGLSVIDMHAALEGKPWMLPDFVHPNTEGAGEMARAAFAALDGYRATPLGA